MKKWFEGKNDHRCTDLVQSYDIVKVIKKASEKGRDMSLNKTDFTSKKVVR